MHTLGSKFAPHRPFVKKNSGSKHNRLYSDCFRIVVEPGIVKSYSEALEKTGFCKNNWTPILIPIVSKLVSNFGPSDRIRTCGILLPKQARYQLRYTRLCIF